MTMITFVEPSGSHRPVRTRPGMSLMEAAVRNGIRGIIAQCGGSGVCATCQISVDPASPVEPPEASELEIFLLEAAADPQSGARLSCQIKIGAAMDGMIVRVVENQGLA